jgi:hypothetical protein
MATVALRHDQSALMIEISRSQEIGAAGATGLAPTSP